MAVKWRDYNLTDCFGDWGWNCSVNFPQTVSASNNQVGRRVKVLHFFFRCSEVEKERSGSCHPPVEARDPLHKQQSEPCESSLSYLSEEVWGTDDAPESHVALFSHKYEMGKGNWSLNILNNSDQPAQAKYSIKLNLQFKVCPKFRPDLFRT